ncbi:hypothetical protein SERLADRAFT_410960 [Serpula lacrymans var. lacrymans S7.9]|uniref:Alpha-type protein kinase domain-containing protein n=1 Tax=Serpula lacrymans var. lacrymans (strain S7.9) TaxID=578457 RepID=F8P887_SERL9|nr:uncharacterized protein SERLADRAFT_410960 [Serpula lacrymans var. lacrymans S7.9]EGO20643.1 hypothetical protein SERLADRAFT_410960 [Serpula lacrymans var. lacrymans S7.9]
MDFTPTTEGPSFKTCNRCRTEFDRSIQFLYIKGRDGTGRHCCPDCAAHYQRKRAEARENINGGTSNGSVDFTKVASSTRGIDATSRQALVKASSAAQRGEQSFPKQYIGMGHAASMPPPHVPVSVSISQAIGYTHNHNFHTHHHTKMLASTVAPQRQVTIRIALHHVKYEGKSGTELVGNIERDISVPLSIKCGQLCDTIIENLKRLWVVWSCDHQLALKSLQMLKAPLLLIYDPEEPQRYSERLILHNFFFRASGKDSTPKFLPNIKVSIILLMLKEDFEDILLWKEEDKHAKARLRNEDAQSLGNTSCYQHQAENKPENLVQKRHQCSILLPHVALCPFTRKYQPENRILSMDTPPPDVPPFSVLDKAVLQCVMMAQGDVRCLAKPILSTNIGVYVLFLVPSIPFTDLLKKRVPFDVMNQFQGNAWTGWKLQNVSSGIVEGAEVSKTPSSPLGGHKRLAVQDKLVKMLDEANCLYWATSLMTLVYNFIDDKLIRRPLVYSPPIIPRLRIVHAALAIPQDTRESRNTVYLLEERISGQFVKCISNNCATPCHSLAPAKLEITTFLCFAQHAQYHFSQGLVFVSDFQALIFAPIEFANNFGEGNWTATLDNFPSLHKCNEYCLYFGLPSLAIAGSATTKRALQEVEADIMSSRVHG